MKFTVRTSPNHRDDISTKRIMAELTLGLLAVFAFSLAYYATTKGADYAIHAVILMVTSIVTALVTEAAYAAIKKKNVAEHIKASFPLVTAIILTLMVQINTSAGALALGTFFAIFIGKLIFGGFGQNIFNPAATGRALILTSFAGAKAADIVSSATPLSSMSQLGWIITDPTKVESFLQQFGGLSGLFLGLHQGAIGETSKLLIIIVGIVLAYRKVLDWRVPVFYIGTVLAITTVIGLMTGAGLWYPAFHIAAGGLVFGAVFMATDPVTNPTSAAGRIIFAMGCGILTVLIRTKASLPGGVLYSILIMNMLTPLIEKFTDGWQIKTIGNNKKFVAGMAVLALLVGVWAGSTLTPVNAEEPAEEITANLGDSLNLFNDTTSNAPEVLEKKAEGDVVTYKMSAKGYAVTEGGYADAKPNIVEVKLNKATKKIESVAVLEVNDTNGIGTQVKAKNFLDQFAGLSYEDKSATVDAVATATVSSTSVVKAVRMAVEDLGKE
jgi:electron transport complex protein RnfD